MFFCDILSFKVVVNVLNCVDYRYCLVPGCNAMLMSKPSHCLSKVRDKVYTEPSQDSFARTVNSSRYEFVFYEILEKKITFV